MEREIGSAVNLALTVIAIAAVISLAMLPAFIGNSFKEQTLEYASDQVIRMQSSRLSSIAIGGKVNIPMASMYSLLNIEYASVGEVVIGEDTWTINNDGKWDSSDKEGQYWFPADLLITEYGIGGKCDVTIAKNQETGLYSVVMSSAA